MGRSRPKKDHNHQKGPGLFSAIGRQAEGILRGGYTYNHQLNISIRSDSGLTISSSLLRKQAASTCNVTGQYKYKIKNSMIGVDVYTLKQKDEQGPLAGSVAARHKYKNTTINVKVCSLPQLSIQHLHEYAALNILVTLKESPEVRLSGTIGTPGFAFGMEANYNAARNHFYKYKAGIRLTNRHFDASVILTNKNDLVVGSYVHKLNLPKRIMAVGEIKHRFSTNKNTLTIGGSCAINHLTMVKLSISSHGRLGTHVQHKINLKSILRFTSEFDVKALKKVPRTGLALALTL